MKNNDNQCFKWCVARALFPIERDSERIDRNLRDNSKRINWSGLKFPIELSDIKQFQNLNQNISINVFGFEKVIYPLRIFKGQEREHQVNLLLIPDEEEGKKHYCLIKNMSRLLSKQLSKHNGLVHICFRCLNAFPNENALNIHKEICQSHEFIEMPKKGNFHRIRNSHSVTKNVICHLC